MWFYIVLLILFVYLAVAIPYAMHEENNKIDFILSEEEKKGKNGDNDE